MRKNLEKRLQPIIAQIAALRKDVAHLETRLSAEEILLSAASALVVACEKAAALADARLEEAAVEAERAANACRALGVPDEGTSEGRRVYAPRISAGEAERLHREAERVDLNNRINDARSAVR